MSDSDGALQKQASGRYQWCLLNVQLPNQGRQTWWRFPNVIRILMQQNAVHGVIDCSSKRYLLPWRFTFFNVSDYQAHLNTGDVLKKINYEGQKSTWTRISVKNYHAGMIKNLKKKNQEITWVETQKAKLKLHLHQLVCLPRKFGSYGLGMNALSNSNENQKGELWSE